MTYFLLYDGNIEMKQTWSPQLKIVKMLQNDLTLAKTLWLLRGQELAGCTPHFNIWWDPFQIAGNVLWHQYDTKRSCNIATNNLIFVIVINHTNDRASVSVWVWTDWTQNWDWDVVAMSILSSRLPEGSNVAGLFGTKRDHIFNISLGSVITIEPNYGSCSCWLHGHLFTVWVWWQ